MGKKKIKIVCKCEQNAFLQKYHKELELLFQSKFKIITPASDKSLASDDDKSKKHIPSKSTISDDADTPDNKKVYFSETTEELITTPTNSLTSVQSKILDIFKPTDTKLTPIVEEVNGDDDNNNDSDSIKSITSSTHLQTKSIVNIKEKRDSALQIQVNAKRLDLERMMHNIEKSLSRTENVMNEDKLLKTLSVNIGTVSQVFKKMQIEKTQLEMKSTIELVKGISRQPFDITEQEFQIQDLIERIQATLQSIQDNQIVHIMEYISELKGEKIDWNLPRRRRSSPKRRSSTKTKSLSIFEPTVELSLSTYLNMIPEAEEEEEEREKDEMEEEELLSDYSSVYTRSCWKQIQPFLKENDESMEDYQYDEILQEDDLSTPMKRAEYYLRSRKIYMLFRFLGAHLVAASPDNPVEFLLDLLEQCYDYRAGLCTAPLLFELRHVESMYQSLDPMGMGEITIDQYFTGLFTFGLTSVTIIPQLNHNLMVNKETFINDVCKNLTEQFDNMIRLPGEVSQQSTSRSFSRMSLTRSG